MRGTLVCGVDDSNGGRRALQRAGELSKRLDLRLVLVHGAGGIAQISADGDGLESVSMQATRQGAARLLARLAAEHGVDSAELRIGTGDAAAVIGRVAAEEAADLIVVGSRERGRLRRGLESRLAERLAAETPVAVLIVPPDDRRTATMAA